jgi:hypothetical protein
MGQLLEQGNALCRLRVHQAETAPKKFGVIFALPVSLQNAPFSAALVGIGCASL